MRPLGEIRCAVLNAAQVLYAERGEPITWRDLASHAQVGFFAARQAVKDMARAGELVRVGSRHVPGARRPMATYAPVPREASGPPALQALMRTWSR